MTIASVRRALRASRGFTLVEIAIVLAIVGVLLGALLPPLATHTQMRRIERTSATLERVEQALLGFALGRGRLPCADTDGDGEEDRDVAGACMPGALEGMLPWATLGTAATDAWGRVIRYRVSEEFTHAVGTGMPPAPHRLDLRDTRGSLSVHSRAEDRVPITLAADVPVVVVSTGANGAGGILAGGRVAGPAPAGSDEAENLDGDEIFVRRAHTPQAASCDDGAPARAPCEFDDLVRWIPAPVLLYALVRAGLLP